MWSSLAAFDSLLPTRIWSSKEWKSRRRRWKKQRVIWWFQQRIREQQISLHQQISSVKRYMDSLPVLDNDQYVQQCLSKYHTYHFEYVPGFTKQQLPVLFYLDFYDNLPVIVRLLDPIGNLFFISTKESKGRIYLCHGSTRIGEVYNLLSGGWVTLSFTHVFTFHMQVRDKVGRQVAYPSPSRRFGLGEVGFGMPIGNDEGIDAVHFHNSCVKDLSPEEVNSHYLFLHVGFCRIAFSSGCTSITLVNFRGRQWVCKFEWHNVKPGYYCCITDGWPIFRGLNGVSAGDSLKFDVSRKNRKYLFVKVL